MTFRVPSDLAWVTDQRDDGSPPDLYLMHVPDGVPLVLTGTAALIWLLAIEDGEVAAALAEIVEDPPPDIEATTAAYLADLVARGLLLEPEGGP